MSSTHIVHGLPSSAPFLAHPDSVTERVRQHNFSLAVRRMADEAAGRQREAWPKPFRPSPAAWAMACGLDESWRRWDMLRGEHNHTRLPLEQWNVCATARRARPLRHCCRVPLFWMIASAVTRPASAFADLRVERPEPEFEGHMHAETLINGRQIHIDAVALTKYSPGRFFKEFRVFVDGQLAGRGGRCGISLGGGGDDLPAVALVDKGLALSVDDASDACGPVVELWEVVVDDPSA